MPERLPSVPGSLQSAPGPLLSAPGPLLSAPGALQSAPGPLQSAPGSLPAAPGPLLSVPGSLPSVSESLPSAPEPLPAAPESLQPTPESLPAAPELLHPTGRSWRSPAMALRRERVCARGDRFWLKSSLASGKLPSKRHSLVGSLIWPLMTAPRSGSGQRPDLPRAIRHLLGCFGTAHQGVFSKSGRGGRKP